MNATMRPLADLPMRELVKAKAAPEIDPTWQIFDYPDEYGTVWNLWYTIGDNGGTASVIDGDEIRIERICIGSLVVQRAQLGAGFLVAASDAIECHELEREQDE